LKEIQRAHTMEAYKQFDIWVTGSNPVPATDSSVGEQYDLTSFLNLRVETIIMAPARPNFKSLQPLFMEMLRVRILPFPLMGG
jgi:hypothetical protein